MDTTRRTKTILCYGDSNTWGFNPYDIQNRYQYEQRWTSILAKGLGPGYQVIPEGLNGGQRFLTIRRSRDVTAHSICIPVFNRTNLWIWFWSCWVRTIAVIVMAYWLR
ncbi:MAG: hypothetical protein PHS18_01455 [Sphaerochaetaceae bacterium]|nr:hypothetical protein [Sphaerochaetaceae bacterium]